MIEAATQTALDSGVAAEFRVGSLQKIEPKGEPFDFVFVSPAIAEHIQGREKRIEFYEKACSLIRGDGALYLSPEIRSLPISSIYFWASVSLRLRWLHRQRSPRWEPGDSARTFFGGHNQDFRPVFYHFYPDFHDFAHEVEEAGLKIVAHHQGGFLLRPKARA